MIAVPQKMIRDRLFVLRLDRLSFATGELTIRAGILDASMSPYGRPRRAHHNFPPLIRRICHLCGRETKKETFRTQTPDPGYVAVEVNQRNLAPTFQLPSKLETPGERLIFSGGEVGITNRSHHCPTKPNATRHESNAISQFSLLGTGVG